MVRFVALLPFFASALVWSLAIPFGSDSGALHLQPIQARLIYDDGSLSENIVDPSNVWTLWNTIIGEGDAKNPSHATMVEVPVIGQPHSDPRPAVVRLSIDKARFHLPDMPLAAFDSSGQQVVKFRLEGTGCVPLHMKAQLIAPGVADSVFEDIEFACGE